MGGETVSVFFYGSYMNESVLAEVGVAPAEREAARLWGFDIRIRPLANLVPSERASVWGVLSRATGADLAQLYTHARDVLGETYFPRAVLVETAGGRLEPALCYVADEMPDGAPAPDYVERILRPARELGFPRWYLEKLESFL
jgi:hypothetical protein